MWSLEGTGGLVLKFPVKISGGNAPVGVVKQFSLSNYWLGD